MSDAWYYVDNDAQAGPVSFEWLQNFLLSPPGGKRTLVWRKGLQDWKAAGEMPELAAVFEGPPPIPRRSVAKAEPVVEPIPRLTDPAVAPPPKLSVGKRALWIAASIFGAGIGMFVVKAFGATLLWPVALIGIAWFILAKCKIEPLAIPMVAVLLGHTGWIVVGHVTLWQIGRLTGDQLWFLLDVVVVTCLALWFFATRSRASAIGMLVYQIVALVVGMIDIGTSDLSFPGVSRQGLMVAQAMHIILRVVGIGLCIYVVAEMGKKTRSVQQTPSLT